MDLELDLDDDTLASIHRLAARAGIEPEEWARLALRSHLGLPLTAVQQAALRPPPARDTPPL